MKYVTVLISRDNVVTGFRLFAQLKFSNSIQCESKNHPPPCDLQFSDNFSQTVKNFKPVFTHLLYVSIYARLQIFIQLSQILTKFCHIKREFT